MNIGFDHLKLMSGFGVKGKRTAAPSGLGYGWVEISKQNTDRGKVSSE